MKKTHDNNSSTLKNIVRAQLRGVSHHIGQAGQDFWVFGEVFNEMRRGYFLEIGSLDGISLSNTYLLERRYDWSGICIEANPVIFEQLKENRKATCLMCCLDSENREIEFLPNVACSGIVAEDVDNKAVPPGTKTIKMQTKTLRQVLQEQNAPHQIDYLSIDVEGAEERILKNFDFETYTFRCLTVERPTALLREIFQRHGYMLIKEIPGLDCFYIHRDYLEDYKQNVLKFYNKRRFAFSF